MNSQQVLAAVGDRVIEIVHAAYGERTGLTYEDLGRLVEGDLAPDDPVFSVSQCAQGEGLEIEIVPIREPVRHGLRVLVFAVRISMGDASILVGVFVVSSEAGGAWKPQRPPTVLSIKGDAAPIAAAIAALVPTSLAFVECSPVEPRR